MYGGKSVTQSSRPKGFGSKPGGATMKAENSKLISSGTGSSFRVKGGAASSSNPKGSVKPAKAC